MKVWKQDNITLVDAECTLPGRTEEQGVSLKELFAEIEVSDV